jgi:hypothetical protein
MNPLSHPNKMAFTFTPPTWDNRPSTGASQKETVTMNEFPESPETEADAIRAETIRRAQVRQLVTARPVSPEQQQVRGQRRQEIERKRTAAIANAERDAPIRLRFHEWMERSGFRPIPIPEPGRSYSGSHMETLWEAYLDATLQERTGK